MNNLNKHSGPELGHEQIEHSYQELLEKYESQKYLTKEQVNNAAKAFGERNGEHLISMIEEFLRNKNQTLKN